MPLYWWSMIFSGLPAPAGALGPTTKDPTPGFTQAENRRTPRIKSGASFSGIMR